jgi:hypothetical protein
MLKLVKVPLLPQRNSWFHIDSESDDIFESLHSYKLEWNPFRLELLNDRKVICSFDSSISPDKY